MHQYGLVDALVVNLHGIVAGVLHTVLLTVMLSIPELGLVDNEARAQVRVPRRYEVVKLYILRT